MIRGLRYGHDFLIIAILFLQFLLLVFLVSILVPLHLFALPNGARYDSLNRHEVWADDGDIHKFFEAIDPEVSFLRCLTEE